MTIADRAYSKATKNDRAGIVGGWMAVAVRHLRSCRAYLPPKTSPGAPHAQGKVGNVRGRSRHRKPRDLIELRSRAGVPNALMRRLIPRLAKHGLAFGPSLRGVREIWRRDGEAIGEIELPHEASADHGSYLLNPALLDACLQCLAWALPAALTQQKAWLPLAMEQFVRIRAAGRKIWSHAVLIDAGSSGNATIRADLGVYDEDGLVAELRGIVLRPSPQSQAVASPFYEVAWQIDDRKREDCVSWLPAPRTLENEIGSRLEPLARQHDLEGYHRATVALDAYCGAWIARAFVELGWSPRVGEPVSSDDLGERLGVAPRYRRLLVRLLDILAEDGLLARNANDEAGWVVLRASLSSPRRPRSQA